MLHLQARMAMYVWEAGQVDPGLLANPETLHKLLDCHGGKCRVAHRK